MAFSPEGVEVKQSGSSEKEPELLLPGKLIRIDKKHLDGKPRLCRLNAAVDSRLSHGPNQTLL